jgi:hypothetical protein
MVNAVYPSRVVRLWIMIAALLVLTIVRVAGAAPAPASVEGTYVLDPGASDDVLKAIDGVVAEMSSLKAPFARRRLRELNQPPRRIDVASTASDVSITTDERDTIRTPADGRPVQWTRDDGETFTIRSVWDARTLKRVFVADDGERANSYAFSPDGAMLRMSVVLTSPQLPGPLAYTLVYRRAH